MLKATSQERAVKIINTGMVKSQQRLHEEMEIMRLLDHPNIVRLYETFEDEKHVYMVVEICKGGELFEYIVDSGAVPEKAAAVSLSQMLLAINYLHQNRLMHRDLKPENWLLYK